MKTTTTYRHPVHTRCLVRLLADWSQAASQIYAQYSDDNGKNWTNFGTTGYQVADFSHSASRAAKVIGNASL